MAELRKRRWAEEERRRAQAKEEATRQWTTQEAAARRRAKPRARRKGKTGGGPEEAAGGEADESSGQPAPANAGAVLADRAAAAPAQGADGNWERPCTTRTAPAEALPRGPGARRDQPTSSMSTHEPAASHAEAGGGGGSDGDDAVAEPSRSAKQKAAKKRRQKAKRDARAQATGGELSRAAQLCDRQPAAAQAAAGPIGGPGTNVVVPGSRQQRGLCARRQERAAREAEAASLRELGPPDPEALYAELVRLGRARREHFFNGGECYDLRFLCSELDRARWQLAMRALEFGATNHAEEAAAMTAAGFGGPTLLEIYFPTAQAKARSQDGDDSEEEAERMLGCSDPDSDLEAQDAEGVDPIMFTTVRTHEGYMSLTDAIGGMTDGAEGFTHPPFDWRTDA